MSSDSFSNLRAPVAILAALAACAALVGCETPLERAFGDSQRAHVAQSVAHPEAGLRDPAAPRVDGISTDAALNKDRAHEVKTEEKTSDETIINIGN